jgi:signal transduction histidine kinase
MIALRTKEPFTRPGLARRGAPFAILLAAGFVLFLFGTPRDWSYFVAALAVAVASCAAAALVPWERLPPTAVIVPPLAVVLSIVLLREGQGGSLSGYGALFLVPTLWVACYGTRMQLAILLAGVLVAFWAPIVLIGEPAYPTTQWRSGGLLVVIVGFFGFVIQQLLENLLDEERRRLDVERRLREASAYELHDDVVQNLTVAQLALGLEDAGTARAAVDRALKVAQHIVELLLTNRPDSTAPGSFVREIEVDQRRARSG